MTTPENGNQDDDCAKIPVQDEWVQHLPWGPTTSITAYFTLLDCFQVSLGNRGIAMSNEEKTMAAGA
jgi:hypothetical protein